MISTISDSSHPGTTDETFQNLTIERDGAVALLWLDRPERLNALHRPLWESIPAAVAHLDADPEVRVVVLAGRGKAFCAGFDLMDHAAALAGGGAISGRGESAVGRRRALYDDVRRYQRTMSCFADTNKPGFTDSAPCDYGIVHCLV